MKILIACSSRIDLGSGILSYAKSMACYYSDFGHEVGFIYLESESNEWFDDKENIKPFPINVEGSAIEETNKLMAFINDFQPDLVINNDNSFLQTLAPNIACPFLFVLHLGMYSILSLAKINSDYVDKYIATTSDMKEDLVNIGISSHKIKVILNTLKDKKCIDYRNRLKKRDVIKVVFAGEPTKRKGYDKFLKLLAKKRFDNYEFHWTGGKSAFKYEQLINKKNTVFIYDKLPQSEFHELMSSSDIFLMPSRDEGLPIALLEALSYGLLCIVSNGRGAMKEVIRHGATGFVCDIDNWEMETSEILSEIDVVEISRLGRNAFDFFDENLSNGINSEQIFNTGMDIKYKNNSVIKKLTYYSWHRPNVHNVCLVSGLWRRVKVRFGLIPVTRK